MNRTDASERNGNLRQLKNRRLVLQTSISTEIVYGNKRINKRGIKTTEDDYFNDRNPLNKIVNKDGMRTNPNQISLKSNDEIFDSKQFL